MEDDLDRIETGTIDTLQALNRFYGPFKKELDSAGDTMVSIKGVGVPAGLSCPSCGGDLNIKIGKNGHFLACKKYPDCRYTSDYVRTEKGDIEAVKKAEEELTDIPCEKCGAPMVKKAGKFGPFLACSGYPECKQTKSLSSTGGGKALGVPCPEPGCTGEILEKTSKRGKPFYGCSRYPDCKFALWDKPVPVPCPTCGHRYLVEKNTKKEGLLHICPAVGCGYKAEPTP